MYSIDITLVVDLVSTIQYISNMQQWMRKPIYRYVVPIECTVSVGCQSTST